MVDTGPKNRWFFCIVDDLMIKKKRKEYPNGVFSMTLPLFVSKCGLTEEGGPTSAYSPSDVGIVISDLVVSLSASLLIDLGHFVGRA